MGGNDFMGCVCSASSAAPERFVGTWTKSNKHGKDTFIVSADGRVTCTFTNSQDGLSLDSITRMGMTGWEDGLCTIRGHFCCHSEELTLQPVDDEPDQLVIGGLKAAGQKFYRTRSDTVVLKTETSDHATLVSKEEETRL